MNQSRALFDEVGGAAADLRSQPVSFILAGTPDGRAELNASLEEALGELLGRTSAPMIGVADKDLSMYRAFGFGDCGDFFCVLIFDSDGRLRYADQPIRPTIVEKVRSYDGANE